MDWEISSGVVLVQLAAAMAYADQGNDPSRLQFFSSARVAPGAPAGATPQFEIVLAKPCGTIVDGVWSLTAAVPGGTLVLVDGIPRWARWLAGNGAWVADGGVTDMDHGGSIRLAGGATPPGDDSPMMYAGGLAVLGSTSFT